MNHNPLLDLPIKIFADGADWQSMADFYQQPVAGVLSPDVPAVVSVFAGRIADTGVDPVPMKKESLRQLRGLPSTEVLWARVREVLNIFQAAACGCHIVTVPHAILTKVIKLCGMDLEALSLDTVRMFHDDTVAAGFTL